MAVKISHAKKVLDTFFYNWAWTTEPEVHNANEKTKKHYVFHINKAMVVAN